MARKTDEVDARMWTIGQVAKRLGHARSWLTPVKLAELRAEGFPPYDTLLRGFDGAAIERWLDARSRLDAPSVFVDEDYWKVAD